MRKGKEITQKTGLQTVFGIDVIGVRFDDLLSKTQIACIKGRVFRVSLWWKASIGAHGHRAPKPGARLVQRL